MSLKASQIYYNHIFTYDALYKNYDISYYQIPKIQSLIISFYGQAQKIKYFLYSLLFFYIKTLQKPSLLFKKKLKISLMYKHGLFIGGKVQLRKRNLYIFLTDFHLRLYPLILSEKVYIPLSKVQKNYTIQLTNMEKGFPEMEIFYAFFQHLHLFMITFEISSPQMVSLLLSQCRIPLNHDFLKKIIYLKKIVL
jgi:ribosomal protein L5